MKKLVLLFLVSFLFSNIVLSQDAEHPDYIKPGFYMKLGAAIPVGSLASDQYIPGTTLPDTLYSAKAGPVIDFGYLIYLGPSFGNHMFRAGIDAVFFSAGFNKSTREVGPEDNKYDFWYFHLGQRFGPLFTINPVDRLMLDLSYKLGFVASEYNDNWGYNMAQNEFSLGVRYRIIAFSVSYDWGRLNYNDFDKSNPEQIAHLSTVRIMVGLKF